ncbi:hypothetical protein NBG4_860012 [Candidatus Sulfobium mesophilum]|uniref:Uncharacterized protein n=1 Tax=Candidatus Sulfobium mesophilum TaxID=2016548 RepID=A0A2U3QKW8_9BACT|nr:hypothetical protein NBG4_860012 [Candidatus Sulfobium mesophilum]
MRKKLTLTIEPEVYDMIKELPRKVSISEFVSFALKAMYKDLKSGRGMTDEQLEEWMESTPEMRDFRERLTEHWGPTIYKIDDAINGIKEKVIPGKKKRKKEK